MKYFILLVFVSVTAASFAQRKYTSEKTLVSFYSHAPLEDISAENTRSSAIYNPDSGEIAFSVPMKDFKFRKSLMQQHFNEKYVESEKFPKATFQGTITNTNGQAIAKGKLTIHGVTKDVGVPGTLDTKGNKIVMKSKFKVALADYNITIPQLVFQNIAEEVEVTLDFTFKPM